MVTVNRPGQMAPSILENGGKIEHMVKVSLSMLMEIYMMDSGLTIKQMGQVSIDMSMALNMKVSGKTICNMAKVLKHGLINHIMKVNMHLGANTELEHISGMMDHSTLEIGGKTRYQVLVSIPGLMVDVMKVSGLTIIWKVWGSTFGMMAVCIKGSTKMTKNTGSVSILGLTKDATKDFGTKASSTV